MKHCGGPDRPALGIGGEDLESNVDAHGGTVSFFRRLSEVADDERVPVPIGPVDEVGGLGHPFERAVLLELEASAELLGHPEPASVGVEVRVPPGAVLPELYRVPALRALEAREACLPSKLPAAMEETLERFVEPVGEGLHRGLGDVLGARATATTLEPIRKVVAGEELPRLLVMRLDHLKHFVVNVAAFGQARKEQAMLFAVRIQTVLESLVHTTILYCNRDPVARAFT